MGTDILIIDDHEDFAEPLADLLALDGHSTRVANSETAGIAEARRNRPDVILLDLSVRNVDGEELARRFRRMRGFERVRLIALTEWENPDATKTVTAASHVSKPAFDRYMAKPILYPEIRAAVSFDARRPTVRADSPAAATPDLRAGRGS